MNHLKKQGLSFILMSVLAVTTFAGETGTPPCADPGQTSTPPCPTQSVNDESTAPGETQGPPAASAVDVTDIAETLLWSLLLF